ncbi:MAG: FHA domain-containing protein [Symploca sp. SIO1C2]|nr:FHA domain-containing protein [Symploca sp. SIO1C2]
MQLELKLLDRSALTWTLESSNGTYIVGSHAQSDVTLPYSGFVSEKHLELSYDIQESKWYLKDLNSEPGTFIEKRQIPPETPIPIRGQTYINLGGNLKLLATPGETSSSATKSAALKTSTRLLCGYAYLGGMFHGFELLNQLRCDPYKAQIPGSGLDLEKITLHATQSVLTSSGYGLFALLVTIIQIWIVLVFGWNTTIQLLIALIPASTTAYELFYLRWSRASKFLKKNYQYSDKFMEIEYEPVREIVKFFKQQIFEKEEKISQNIIIFGGDNPFLGAGERIPNSSWTIPITRKSAPKQEEELLNRNKFVATATTGKPEIIDIPHHEFYQVADQGISRLGLPNLEISSQLFVDGFELEADQQILINPTTRPAILALDDPIWIQENPASSKRSYRVYRYVDMERDYVLSFFLRFYNVGAITFVESSAYILPGIDRDRFSLTSTLDSNKFLQILKTLLAAIILVPGLYIPLAIWYIATFSFNAIMWKINNHRQQRAAEFQEEYNYGIPYTFREFISEKLNLEVNRSFDRGRGVKNDTGFKLDFRFKKIITNPILLLFLFIFGAFLIIPGLIGIIIYYIFRFYRNPTKEIKTNLDYYGTQDLLMYWQAIQDSIFRNTVKLLRSNNIDTSQLEQILQQIVNNGVIVNANNLSGNVNQIQNSGVVGGVSMGGGTISNVNANQSLSS